MLQAAGLLGLTLLQNQADPARAELYTVAVEEQSPPVITHMVYLDVAVAARSFKADRTLGDKSIMPLDDAAPIGRIVLGLYGEVAPSTVANFLQLIASEALKNTVFSRVLPGEYIMAGQQGAYRMGQVDAAKANLASNPDLTSPSAFRLRHLRPGTLSLALAESDDDPGIRQQPRYSPCEFLITTGPGPVPRLDESNVVFGRVVEGMAVVSTITAVPTFKPSQNSQQMNTFAQSIGDDRAATVRRKYGKPLKAVIITGAGVLPTLTPAPTATSSA